MRNAPRARMGTVRTTPYDPDHEHHELLYPPPDAGPPPDAAIPEPTPDAISKLSIDRPSDEEYAARIAMATGSSYELFTGLLGVVLSVIGLSGTHPAAMAAMATIAVGLSLLAQGLTIAARWQAALKIEGRERIDVLGISTEMFGGLAAIILGVLALLGVLEAQLLSAAAIVLGFSLLLGGPAQPEVSEETPEHLPTRLHVTRDIVRASSGVMVMGGLAAIVLGLLAATGLGPVIGCVLASLLCVAVSLMLAGGSLFARFSRRFG
ncbi:MAG: hypothetical protein JWP01_3526 [Myxococcales bacterium]|nr:hypothetical protein [Myxococcales bacterium]